MSDLSANEIIDLSDNILPSIQTSAQRYYLKNRDRIIQRNKERILNKYHQSTSYLKNKERRENKRALKIKTDGLKNELNDISVKIKILKFFIDELKNKELDIRVKIRDVIHDHNNISDSDYNNIIEPLLL